MLTPEWVQKHLGTPQESEVRSELFRADIAHWCNNRVAWLQKYGKQWVAVYQQKLVAVAPTREEVLVKIDEADISSGEILVLLLGTKNRTQILCAA